MTKSELISNLADLEWEDFEVKAAVGGLPKSSWETVSAFANTTGGWLVYGVRQSGKSFIIQGLSNPEKIEQDFLNAIRSGKFNVFIPTQQMKYEVKGKKVIAFYIPVSAQKPVYFNTLSNTYIRRGSSDQKATKEEIDAMFRDQTFGTKTSELVAGTSEEDIDLKSLQQYREYMSRFNPEVGYNRLDTGEFITKLRISDPQSDQLTYAGLLFLGTRTSIENYFPDFRIDLLEIPGTSYSDASSRYTFRLSEDDYENLWQAYFECYNRLRKEVKVAYQVSDEGFGEEISPGSQSLREALVNMLMHTDYFSPAHPRIRIFEDRIEFYNPGGLPKPLQELKQKDLSIPRNPILAKFFRMVRIAENAGYGFDKMESNWKEYNQTNPEYEIEFDSVIVKFNLESESKGISEEPPDSLEDILKMIRDGILHNNATPEFIQSTLRDNYGVFTGYLRGIYGVNLEKVKEERGERSLWIIILIAIIPAITRKQMAEVLGVSVSTIEKTLRGLRNDNIISRKGSDKAGQWLIMKSLKGE